MHAIACSDIVVCSLEAVVEIGIVDHNVDQHEVVTACCPFVPSFQSSKTWFVQLLASALPCYRNNHLVWWAVALAAQRALAGNN
jgi:hypothetical protein